MRPRSLLLALLVLLSLVGFSASTGLAQTGVTPIANIQSSVTNGDDSSFVGQSVTVQGIVTGIYGSLFFVQELSLIHI